MSDAGIPIAGAPTARPVGSTRESLSGSRLWLARWFWPAAAAESLIVALGAGRGLGRASLAVDEGFAAVLASTPASIFWDVVTSRETNQVLHYLVLRGIHELGSTEGWLRLPSLLFAVATVPAVAAVGRRVAGPGAGLLAGALLATNGFFVAHARFARGYCLAALLATMSVLCLLRAVERPGGGRMAAWSAVTVLAVYAHFFAALVLLAEAAAVSVHPDRRALLHRSRWAVAALAALLGPLVLFVLRTPRNQIDWVPATTLRTPFQLAYSLSGRGGALLSAALAAAALGGMAHLLHLLHRRGRAEGWPLLLVACWCVVPVATTLAASPFKPLAYDSFLLVSIPGLVVLAATGLARARPALVVVAVALVLPLGVRSVVVARDYKLIHDWRSATAFVLARADTGDALAVGFLDERAPLEYYVTRWGRAGDAPIPVVPPDRWGALEPRSVARPPFDETDLARLRRFDEVIVLHRFSGADPGPTTFPLPRSGFRLVERRQFFHVLVTVYEPREIATVKEPANG